MKYKIFYQKNYKLHSTISNTFNVENIIKIETIEKQIFKVNENSIYLFLFEIKNMLNSGISYIKALQHLQNLNSTKKLSTYLLNNYNQNIANNNILFIFINFSKNSGNFTKNLNLLFDYLDKKRLVKKELISSLKYPLFLIVLLITTFFAISNLILPNFINFYNQNNLNLPLITQIMLKCNDFLIKNYIDIFIGLILFLSALIIFYKEQREIIYKFLFKIKLVKFFELYKFFSLLKIMLEGGKTFQDSLKKLIEIEKNIYFKRKLSKISKSIDSGVNFKKVIKTAPFDTLVKEMLIVGYNSNNLLKVFSDIANFYESNIQKEIRFIKTYLEPTLIFIVFLLIFAMVISVMKPIWNLTNLV